MSDNTIETTEAQAPEEVLTPDTEGVQPVDTPDDDPAEGTDEPDTFPRSYVEKLRQENGKYRERAKTADTLAHRLHAELVRATGKLADPTDLPFDVDHLDDPEALAAAVDDLIGRKPHLASRRPSGDIGQGPAKPSGTVDLAAMLRQRAG